MERLLNHLVKGLVSAPDAVVIHAVEGDGAMVYELSVAPADLASVRGPDGETLRSLRTVLSASSGDRRAVLELIEPGAGEASAE